MLYPDLAPLATIRRKHPIWTTLLFTNAKKCVLICRDTLKQALLVKIGAFRVEHAENMVRVAKRLGIITSIFLSFGYPGETLEQIKQTFSFARKIRPDSVFLSIATPLPGTDLMKVCLERGYVKENHDFQEAAFANANFDTENFTRRELEELYLREAFWLNGGLIIRNPRAFLQRWSALIYNHPTFVLKFLSNFFLRTRQREHYNAS